MRLSRPTLAFTVLTWLVGGGCGGSPAPLPAPSAATHADSSAASSAKASQSPKDAASSGWIPAESTDDERWDVHLIQGEKVGYMRTRISEELSESGDKLERIESFQTLTLRRAGREIRQDLAWTSWEKPTGELVKFECSVTAGRESTITRGQVNDGRLVMETTTPGKSESATLDWQADWGGFFAVDRLIRKGLKPNQRRSVRAIVPVLHQVAATDLEVKGMEAVRIGDESRTLRRIDKVDTLGALRIQSTLWVDDQGEVLRTTMSDPPPGLEVVRATREQALAAAPPASFDLNAATVVPVAGMPADPHAPLTITYIARLPDSPIARAFAAGASQRVEAIDEHTARITVQPVRPTTPESVAREPGPTDDDRKSNGLVQADDPAVVALSREAARDEEDPWKVAVALESLVRRRVSSHNFTPALATAAEVARTGEGDCTEHAVLLAALCRARGIPARVAIGLVYSASAGGFAYHMWNEVWIADRWAPLDATLARGGIGGGHLKMVNSSLRGVDAYAAFLPVFQVLGRLQLSLAQSPPAN